MIHSNEWLTLLLGLTSAERRAFWEARRPLFTLSLLEEWKAAAHQAAYAGNASHALAVAELMAAVGDWAGDDRQQALADWTWGNVCTIIGQEPEAAAHYAAAAQRYRALGEPLNLARLSVGLIGHYNHTGEYEQARRLGEEIWPLLAASPDPADQKRLGGVWNNLAVAYEYLGRYEEALALYERKLALWESRCTDPQAPAEIARARINLGIIKKRLNLWAEAELALELGRRTLAAPEWETAYRLDRVRAELHLADLLARRGAPPETVAAAFAWARLARAALPTAPAELPNLLHLDLCAAEWEAQRGGLTPGTRAQLLELCAHSASADQWREHWRANLLLAETPADCLAVRDAALAHEDAELLYHAWYRLGELHATRGENDTAARAWEAAVSVVEGLGSGVASGDLRSGFLEDKLTVYQALAALRLAEQDAAGALHWVERAQARELTALYAAAPSVADPVDEAAECTWRQARHALALATDPEQRRLLEGQVADLTRRLAALSPSRRAWLTGTTAEPAALCAALPPDTLFLRYAVIRDAVWVWPLSREGAASPRALGPAPTLEAVEQELQWLSAPARYPPALTARRAEALSAAARRPLSAWYAQFLAPLADLLAQHSQVLIAPDGVLFRLPLHAGYDAAAGRYLAETHTVSYTPGATAWLYGGQRPRTGAGGLLLAYDGDLLHHTAAEAQAIQAVCPEFIVYTGAAATPERLQDETAARAAFIHLAAHAVFRGDAPLFSHLALAGDRLETLDVLRLRFNATLVTLSACETGRGLWRGGEYLGLARAFLLAGARTVLASHWTVDDAATAQLMSAFYRALAAGAPPAEALRQAQQSLLLGEPAHYRHPYYWAGFFLLGV